MGYSHKRVYRDRFFKLENELIWEYSEDGKIYDIHIEQFIALRSRERNMQMKIVTDWPYKDMKFLSNGRADHKEVLIQIRSVHRKFLRVPKTQDYSG